VQNVSVYGGVVAFGQGTSWQRDVEAEGDFCNMDTIQPTPVTGTVDPRLATQDAGDINRRILGKKRDRADFKRVEEASLKVKVVLASPDAKRLYTRIFYSYQVNVHLAIKIGRTRLAPEAIEKVNGELHRQMAEATTLLNDALDSAGAELQRNAIATIASYETVPMVDTVAVTSSLANRMLELLVKLDRLMPLISTLEILEVITEPEADVRRSQAKRAVLALSSSALKLWFGVQRRMQEAERAAAHAPAAPAQAAEPPSSQAQQGADPSDAPVAPKQAPRRKRPARPAVAAGSTEAARQAAAPPERPVDDATVSADSTASAEEIAQPA
jgi:hypothetical protein